MTGAGFGGCAIAIVAKDQVAQVTAAVGAVYKQQIGYAADFYIAAIADGPRPLED